MRWLMAGSRLFKQKINPGFHLFARIESDGHESALVFRAFIFVENREDGGFFQFKKFTRHPLVWLV